MLWLERVRFIGADASEMRPCLGVRADHRLTGPRTIRLPGAGTWPIVRPMTHPFQWLDFADSFAHHAAAAGFAPVVLSDTAAGPLVAWERREPGPRVYLSAGIHGDEPAGPLALLELVRGGFFGSGVDWAICPALNPTGLAGGRRETADGRDMNRDYLRRRTPEVRSHVAWLESRPVPALFLSLHEDWETPHFYFYEINTRRDDPPRARAILSAVGPWFAPQPGPDIDGHTPREAGWIYHAAEPDVPTGWPEAIYLAKAGCPLSFTFETPSSQVLASRVAAQCAAVAAAFGGSREEILKG